MALTLKLLATGQLATTAATLYPAGGTASTKTALVKNILLTNTDTTNAITVDLTVHPAGGTGRYVAPKSFSVPPGVQVILDAELTLNLNGTADLIKGYASTASKIDYVINGVERDI